MRISKNESVVKPVQHYVCDNCGTAFSDTSKTYCPICDSLNIKYSNDIHGQPIFFCSLCRHQIWFPVYKKYKPMCPDCNQEMKEIKKVGKLI